MPLPKAKSAPKQKAPKLKSNNMLVLVELSNKGGVAGDPTATAEKNVSKVIDWYTQRMKSTKGQYDDNNDFTGLKNFKISHVADNLFEFDYKTVVGDKKVVQSVFLRPDWESPRIIADPDSEGKYPIKIGNFNYVISGNLIELDNGKLMGNISKPKKAGAKKIIIRVLAPGVSFNANAKKIIAWYKKAIKTDPYYKTIVAYFNITHITGNLFACEYKSSGSEDEVVPGSMADPAHGHGELKIGKSTYYIEGSVVRKF